MTSEVVQLRRQRSNWSGSGHSIRPQQHQSGTRPPTLETHARGTHARLLFQRQSVAAATANPRAQKSERYYGETEKLAQDRVPRTNGLLHIIGAYGR
jgi:hypothetical protein